MMQELPWGMSFVALVFSPPVNKTNKLCAYCSKLPHEMESLNFTSASKV